MKVAILESIIMPAGHEVEFDKILIDELKRQGHEPCFFVPEKFPFKLDYQVPVYHLSGGEAVTYAGANRLQKIWLSWQREHRRIKWFNAAYDKIKQGLCDQIIIPTATYRYLRTLLNSDLKNSSIPVNFIFHGINPREKDLFLEQAKKCLPYENINLKIITLRNDFVHDKLKNIELIAPPIYTAWELNLEPEFKIHSPLRLGFFGQYRKEKNLEFFLDSFVMANFSRSVELIVQGATAKPSDGEDFERLSRKYGDYKNIIFRHENLIGKNWQQALLDVDVIMLPYAAERYLYHWGAMLFTAIGFYKPVLQSPELNPEVLAKYNIGIAIELKDKNIFMEQLEKFVNNFHANADTYQKNLQLANQAYSQEQLIKSLLKDTCNGESN